MTSAEARKENVMLSPEEWTSDHRAANLGTSISCERQEDQTARRRLPSTFPLLSRLGSFSQARLPAVNRPPPEKFFREKRSLVCVRAADVRSEICQAGNRPSSWPTERRGPWAPAAAIPGLGRARPSLDQSIVSLRPRKGESKDEGEEASNSQHAKQCSFSAQRKNASSKGCPSFLQRVFPRGGRSPLC
uniref:Uncharacterized protein n=1 Tax=Rangifer tarandus platyrhynchus TaxID=3082113 RepID=A0ACB0DWL6_RANTA|nr:unnamed protein product [Rangifer tarandus platyrhynchus]